MSRDLDGTDDNIDAGNISSTIVAADFCIIIWLNHDVVGTDFIYGKGTSSTNNFELLVRVSSGYEWRVDQTSGSDLDSVTGELENVWQHLVINRLGSDLRMFIDGTDSANATNSEDGSTTGAFQMGASTGNPGLIEWDGELAECAIYDASWTAAMIAALARGAHLFGFGKNANLIGYWPLYGNDSPEPDFSGNGNTGTVNGGASNVKGATNPPVELLENYL